MKMQMQKTSLGNRNPGAVKRTNQDLSLTIYSTSLLVAKFEMIDGPQSSQALGNKLNGVKTNLRETGIILERPEKKANHSKDVV